MVAQQAMWTSQSPWLPALKQAAIVLISPGMMCGIMARSGMVMVLSAGLCWYLVGVGCTGVIVRQRGECLPDRIALGIGVAWLAAVLLLGIMWANADID
jgi:hypothetical protein